MTAQPTLTRLFAMLAFAGFAVYAATVFQAQQDGARVSSLFNSVAAIMAAIAGWIVAGPRIDARLVGSVFAVGQGVLVACLLGLAAGATAETFRLGYRTRYSDLGEAMQGFFAYIASGVRTLTLPDLLIPLGVFCLLAGVGLSLLFRILEAQSSAR